MLLNRSGKACACTGGRSLRHPQRTCLEPQGSQGSPSLASGQGCLQPLPEPRQVLMGRAHPSPRKQTLVFQEALMRRGNGTSSLAPPPCHPECWKILNPHPETASCITSPL